MIIIIMGEHFVPPYTTGGQKTISKTQFFPSTVDSRNQTQVIRFVWHLAGQVNMVLMRKPDIQETKNNSVPMHDKGQGRITLSADSPQVTGNSLLYTVSDLIVELVVL